MYKRQADSGEGADYGDPSMTEETTAPEPEPTIEPGEGFSEEGNLVTRDLLYDEHTNKQFITVQTSGGNTFYIVIDYDKPVDEEGEQYETLSLIHIFLRPGVRPYQTQNIYAPFAGRGTVRKEDAIAKGKSNQRKKNRKG